MKGMKLMKERKSFYCIFVCLFSICMAPVISCGAELSLKLDWGDQTINEKKPFHDYYYPDNPTPTPTPKLNGPNINTEINFPDPNFRAAVEQFMEVTPGGWFTAEQAAKKTGTLSCGYRIKSLAGIQFFTALTSLSCYSNELTVLDLSKNTALTSLDCGSNKLTTLDVSKNTALTSLSCAGNQLTALDISKNIALADLYCGSNQLTSLDISKNTTLKKLNCRYNKLRVLDITKNPMLTDLDCSENNFTDLDLSKNNALINLSINNSQLATLDLSKNKALKYLSFNANKVITALDISKNTSLKDLYCNNNTKLSQLNASGASSLESIICQNNKLTSIDISGAVALTKLDCRNNELTSINNLISDKNKNLALIDVRYNLLDCGDWNDVKKVFLKIGGPQYKYINWSNNLESGFAYDPQTNLNPYDCNPWTSGENINTVTNFPDSNFRARVEEFMRVPPGGTFTAEQAANQPWSLLCNYNWNRRISSLKGIEYFTSLKVLDCSSNDLTTLDVSKNTALTSLSCGSNKLTALDISKNTALTSLSCGWNKLAALDITKNTALTSLYCDSNQLITLDITKNTALTSLYCSENQLATLDITKNTALTSLYCSENQLATLDITKNTALTSLYCDRNNLTVLDITKHTALKNLYCNNNKLSALDVSKNTALDSLYCNSNQLTTLDVSKNTALSSLDCSSNQLTKLDVLKNTSLHYLYCNSNKLTALDVSKNTSLRYLYCNSNKLTTLDVSKNTALYSLLCNSNQINSIANMITSQHKALSTFDIRFNLLDCSDWKDVAILINKMREPSISNNQLYYGFAYSPQQGLDPYSCQGSAATPTPVTVPPTATPIPQKTYTPTPTQTPTPNVAAALFSETRLLGNGGSLTTDIEFVDFDKDGDLDAIVANYGLPNEVYSNDGKGNFTKISEFGVGRGLNYDTGQTDAIAVGDINKDGFVDVLEANRFGEKSNIYRGDGKGNFIQSGAYTDATFNTTDVELGDLDKDGDLDAVTANESYTDWNVTPNKDYPSKVCIHINNKGVFQVKQTINEGFEPRDIALGDMDNDGDLDIVVGNEGGEDKVYLNDGKGNFTQTITFGNKNDTTFSVALGDVNKDGYLDIALGDFGNWDDLGGIPVQNYVYLNTGKGRSFTPKPITSSYGFTNHIAMGDVDKDGDLDIAVGNFNTYRLSEETDPIKKDVMNGYDYIFLNDGKGNFTQNIRLGSGDYTEFIGFADVNKDGYLDVITGNGDPDSMSADGQNIIYINNFGTASKPTPVVIPPTSTFTPRVTNTPTLKITPKPTATSTPKTTPTPKLTTTPKLTPTSKITPKATPTPTVTSTPTAAMGHTPVPTPSVVDAPETISINLAKLPPDAKKLELVLIPSGTFMMGSPVTEKDRNPDESPQHQVTISRPFYLGKYEISQAQWQAVMGNNPSILKGNNLPVDNISWFDCQTFIQKLNQLSQGTFRLPAEAEWEYACRAGTTTRYYWGDDINYTQASDYAWINNNSNSKTHEIGLKKMNAFGLFDMSGNVWEWCSDWYGKYSSIAQTDPTGTNTGTGRIMRGGNWLSDAKGFRSAARGNSNPGTKIGFGIRLVRVYEGNTPNPTLTPIFTPTSTPTNTPVPVPTVTPKGISNQTITVAISRLPLNAKKLEMVLIPAGTFMMGSPDSEMDRWDVEGPQHQVTISKPFYMGKYEVTQAQWQAVMGSNPSYFKGNNFPVESISWDSCQTFIQKLNQLKQGAFRLPTEAEWEYACRAGTTTRFYWGDDPDYTQIGEYAWYADNSNSKTHDVSLKRPNTWGLFDMSGNVYEWCQDWYGTYSPGLQTDPTGPSSGSDHVFRCGGWDIYPQGCRPALRLHDVPSFRNNYLGFRLVRSYP